MNRRSLSLCIALVIAAFSLMPPVPAAASCGSSMPFVFVNNSSIVDASTTNQNNNFLLGCATTVDNTQIGTAGIYASQIIPTTIGQATFGGSVPYLFPTELRSGKSVIAGFGTALSPLSDGDLLTADSTSSGRVTFGGSVHAGSLDFGHANSNAWTFNNEEVYFLGGASVGGGLVVSSGGFIVDSTNPHFTGSLIVDGTETVNGGQVAPMFTTSGSALASTAHGVPYRVAVVLPGCTSQTTCGATGSVTFSGSAAFANANYTCSGVEETNGANVPPFIVGLTMTNATTLTVSFYNPTSGTTAGTTVTVSGTCWGA